MFHRSIRWRLTISFAGIALLATLALGAVQLLIVRSYYARQERDYLADNTRAISFAITNSLDRDASPETFQARLESFGFVSQSRIQVLGPNGDLVADSGSPHDRRFVSLSPSTPATANQYVPTAAAVPVTQHAAITPSPPHTTVRRGDDTASSDTIAYRLITSTGTTPSDFSISVEGESPEVLVVPAVSPFFGFNRNERAEGHRSNIKIQQPIHNAAGDLLGYLILSEGPAYGSQIVSSVALGWSIASVVAVVVAAGAGWWASRSISAPLLTMTRTTTQMAEGDLSVRLQATERQDEFGTLARAFDRMADRVESIVLTLRSFVSDAAHEILTPLATIRTNLELMSSSDAVTRARTQVARLEALAKGLLDLSRIEAEQRTASPGAMALDALVQEASEPYASAAEQADIAFELLLPQRPITVHGDKEQLARALGNLLDNAIKFTPAGGKVSVTVCQKDGQAVVEIEDTGIGIVSEDLPHLFQRFHRGRNASAYPGSGLGLAIVKAVIAKHGGTTSAENTAQGAKFTVRLDCSRP